MCVVGCLSFYMLGDSQHIPTEGDYALLATQGLEGCDSYARVVVVVL